MKKVPLTLGQFALVDDEDYERVVSFGKWRAHWSRNTYYAEILAGAENDVALKLHRFILNLPKEGWPVDHRNGDGLDNQKGNLRILTPALNSLNRVRLHKFNRSGVTGVCFFKATGKWGASITLNKKQYHLGFFDTVEEAAFARRQRETQIWEDAAKLEVPEYTPFVWAKPLLNSRNTSGFQGVTWNKSKKGFVARVQKNCKRTEWGLFPTAEDAHQARQKFLLDQEQNPTHNLD